HPPCPWPHRCRRQPDHLVPSSTPFLARCGLEALATVRVEEDTGAVPRSNRLCRLWGVAGSVPATGGCRSTARSHILPKFLDTRGVSRSSRTLGTGCGGRGSIGRTTVRRTNDADADGEVVWS